MMLVNMIVMVVIKILMVMQMITIVVIMIMIVMMITIVMIVIMNNDVGDHNGCDDDDYPANHNPLNKLSLVQNILRNYKHSFQPLINRSLLNHLIVYFQDSRNWSL